MSSTANPLPALAEGLPLEIGGRAVLGLAGLTVYRHRAAGVRTRAA